MCDSFTYHCGYDDFSQWQRDYHINGKHAIVPHSPSKHADSHVYSLGLYAEMLRRLPRVKSVEFDNGKLNVDYYRDIPAGTCTPERIIVNGDTANSFRIPVGKLENRSWTDSDAPAGYHEISNFVPMLKGYYRDWDNKIWEVPSMNSLRAGSPLNDYFSLFLYFAEHYGFGKSESGFYHANVSEELAVTISESGLVTAFTADDECGQKLRKFFPMWDSFDDYVRKNFLGAFFDDDGTVIPLHAIGDYPTYRRTVESILSRRGDDLHEAFA